MDKGEHKIVIITLFTGGHFFKDVFPKNIFILTLSILEIIIDKVKMYKSSLLSIKENFYYFYSIKECFT